MRADRATAFGCPIVMPVVVAIDHVGIRIRDKNRSAEFYRKLGFEVVLDDEPARCLELRNRACGHRCGDRDA